MRALPFLAHAVALVVVTLALGCEPPVVDPLPFAPAGPEAAPDPSTFGPYAVGVRTMTFVDETRDAPAPRYSGKRTLTVEVWYPAAESARGKPGQDYVLYEELPESVREGLTPQDLGTLNTIAVRDAAPFAADGQGLPTTFPAIFFSHGKGGVRMQSTFYTVPLASHGYVVIAPDHQGDTIYDLLEDGDVEVTSTIEGYVDRPLDLELLMNEFDAIVADGTDPLATVVDMQRIGATGHSFGALTATIAGGENIGVDVVVAQTPVGIGLVEGTTDVPVRDFGIPMMIQSSGEDQILPADLHAQSLWDAMQPPRAWLHLPRGGHFTYSDLCIFDVVAIDAALEIDASNVLEDGCGPQNIQPNVAFPMINNAAIGYFNVHLRESAPSAKFLAQSVSEALGPGEGELLVE